MYPAFQHSHTLLAVLALLASILFTFMAWKSTPAAKSTLVYVLTRIFGGLAALTGLVVTFVGPWQHMSYPYIGLILYALHGLCAGFAKRQLKAPTPGLRRVLLTAQLILLIATAGIMGAKPF